MTIPHMTDQSMTQRQNGHLTPPDAQGVQGLELSELEKQQVEAAGEYVPVPVRDIEVRVKPQGDWRMSDMRMLNAADFDGFAESVVHPKDLDMFLDLDMTLTEFQGFAEDAAKLAGDGLGKSSARSRSSRNTRRR